MATLKILTVVTAALISAMVTSEASGQCYVDSENGDDGNDGLSESTPKQTQDAIPSDCTEVRYARGSVFNEPVNVGGGFGGGGRTVFTNYGDPELPLPKFVVETGSVVSSFGGGLTIDGLYLAGSTGDGTMQGLMQGVCVSMGDNSQLLNCEITDCDIGIMLMGEGSLVQGNFIHDLNMAVDSSDTGVYANSVGGAEGIFVNGSNNEVAYNTFYNCSDFAEWTGGNCDGGATEVSVGQDGVVENVRVHHNLAIDTCGFFEVSGFGEFRDSEFYYNVMIDSGWMMLLQVNETTLSNITWTNNTAVHHSLQADGITPSITMIYQAEVTPGTVFFNNNLVVFEDSNSFMATVDGNIDQSNSLILTGVDPGFVNFAGKTAADFDLVAGSQAIDAGLATTYTADYFGRVVPSGSAPDIGAFEYGAEEGAGGSGMGGAPSTGGAPATGGAAAAGGNADTGGAVSGGDTTSGGMPSGGDDATGGAPVTLVCTSPLIACGEACVDLTSDATNCGACGAVCESGEVCSTGACQSTCLPGLSSCGQSCVDLSTSIFHCGACDSACQAGQACADGGCIGDAAGADPGVAVPAPVTTDDTPAQSGDSSSDAEDDSGCSCVTADSSPGSHPWGGLLGLVTGLWLMRRRRCVPGGVARRSCSG